MNARRYLIALGLVVCVGLSFVVWRIWQGPSVDVARVERSALVQNVVAAGRVITTSRAQIGVEITGIVQERFVTEGDLVKRGDILLSLRADDQRARLAEAEAALENLQNNRRPQALAVLEQAEFELEQARREADRRRELLKTRSIATELYEKAAQAEVAARSRADQARIAAQALAAGASEERILIERIRAAQAALDKTQIRAQFDGLVLTRQVEPGDQVQPGRVLFEMARKDETEVLVPVDERNLGALRVGQPAICIADAFPAEPFSGRIKSIAPAIDPQRGTVDVRLALDRVPGFLREDMTVTATVTTAEVPDALLAPNHALRKIQGDDATVLVLQFNKAVERQVRLGLRGLTQTQILSGLDAGDAVILSDSIRAGERIRAKYVD